MVRKHRIPSRVTVFHRFFLENLLVSCCKESAEAEPITGNYLFFNVVRSMSSEATNRQDGGRSLDPSAESLLG